MDRDRLEQILDTALQATIAQWCTAARDTLTGGQESIIADASLPNLTTSAAAHQAWLDGIAEWLLPSLASYHIRTAHHAYQQHDHTPTPDGEGRITYPPGADSEWAPRTYLELHATLERTLGSSIARELLPDGADYVLEVPTWRDHITDYLAQVTNRLRDMPGDVFDDLRNALNRALLDGETPTDISRRVAAYLNPTDPDSPIDWRARALRIARTEATGAYNNATLHAALEESQIFDTPLDKIWIATEDGRTRHSHTLLHGQRVPLNDPFLIDGTPIQYPGDPTAPAEQVVNCRCTTITVPQGAPNPVTPHNNTPTITAATTPTEAPMRRPWTGLLAPLAVPTGDGRIIQPTSPDAITTRELPLPLMWQRTTDYGHEKSVIVGKITTVDVTNIGINATGEIFDTPDAEEAVMLISEGVIRPSVDLCDVVSEYVIDMDGNELDRTLEARLMGATLVAKPAFAEARITLDEPTEAEDPSEDEIHALTASAGTLAPTEPREWFSDPKLDEPTALTVTDDGRVYGHLATWGACHVGIPTQCVTPPHSPTSYAFFHVSTLDTTDGPVSVGRLTVGGGHAPVKATHQDATSHYDNTTSTWAYVRAGEDRHGIWVAGVINRDAEPTTIRAGASAPLSGDWRTIGGNLELVAALSVNTPGFPVPRSYSDTRGRDMSLTAAGAIHPTGESSEHREKRIAQEAVRAYAAEQARIVEARDIWGRRATQVMGRITHRLTTKETC